MKPKKLQTKTRFSFFRILWSVLKFIFKSFLWVIAMMLTPRKEEDSTTSDMLIDMAEEDVVNNSFPSPPKKRH